MSARAGSWAGLPLLLFCSTMCDSMNDGKCRWMARCRGEADAQELGASMCGQVAAYK
ncbi:hypothetical protein GCM10017562_03310 [Streptomyces roseofulvus]